MSDAVAQIVAQLNTLSQQERAALAHAVLLSLEPEDPDAEDAWDGCRPSIRAKPGEKRPLLRFSGAGVDLRGLAKGGAFHENEGGIHRGPAVPTPSRERPPP